MDCTRRLARLRPRALAYALVVLGLALAPPAARADGDPASDVLAQQSVFVPQDAGLTESRAAELNGLVAQAGRSGYPVRLAVIASPTDLGSVTELWNQPQVYARFLGQELSLVAHGRLVVVMPAGVGATVIGPSAAAEHAPPAAVAGLRPSSQADLGAVATSAVQRLAAVGGVHLNASPAGATAPSSRASSSPAPWIAFGVGAGLIAVAWGVSLRACPPSWRRTAARAAGSPAAR